MEKNKFNFRSCLAMACFGLTICLLLYSLFTHEFSVEHNIPTAISIAASIYAIVYLQLGSRKIVNRYYKIALLLLASAALATIAETTIWQDINTSIVYVSFYAVYFALLFSMSFAMNLGKKNSTLFALIGFIICLFLRIYFIVTQDISSVSFTTITSARTLAWLLMSLGHIGLVQTKYQDKAERGSDK